MGSKGAGSKQALGAAVESAYRAIGRPAEWHGAFVCLQQALDVDKIALVSHDFDRRCGRIGYGAGIAPEYEASYAVHFAGRNPWLRSPRPFQQKRVMAGDEILPYWELARSEFYAEWLRPQGLHHAIFGVLGQFDAETLYLVAHRPVHGAAFGSSDKRAVGAVLPHLDRALRLERRLLRESSQSLAMVELFGHLREATLLVDRRGRLHAANRAAERLLAQRDGLFLVGGCLACASAVEHGALRRLLAGPPAAMAPAPMAGGRIVVSRPSGRTPLLLLVLPVAQPIVTGAGYSIPVAAILTRDPEGASELCAGELNALYSMTTAEARLAVLIRDGLTLQDAARRLRISKNTARTHMKNVYAKTGVHRQADLVRLLA